MLKSTILCALLLIASPALACGDQYDAERELAAINGALATTTLGKSERDEILALRDKASISPASLSIRGLSLQAQYRQEAMRRLGLQRIPARPDSRFRAVDAAFGKLKPDDPRLAAMKALRTKAEAQWNANDYQGTKASLEDLEKQLGLPVVTFRC